MRSRLLLPGAAAAAVVFLARAAAGLPTAMGAGEQQLRRAADRAAADGCRQAADGLFHNTLPDAVVQRGALVSLLRAIALRGPVGRPARPIP